MTEFELLQAPDVVVTGQFDETCVIAIAAASLQALKAGRLKVKINQHAQKQVISNVRISLAALTGNIRISIGNDNARVHFGKDTSGIYDLRLWRDAEVSVGNNTTSNGVRIVCDLSEVLIGQDCMFSDEVLVQSADQHGIVDLATGEIVNNRMRKTRIGDHVWIGRQSNLMADVDIGDGAIIGAGAIVTRNVPACTVAAGVPARIVKEGVTWSRSITRLDASSRKYVAMRNPDSAGATAAVSRKDE